MNSQLQNNDSDQLLDPKELSQAFEHTMNFVQGNHDVLPDMMHDAGRVLLKVSRKLSTTQMVLLVGALTLGALFMVKRVEEAFDEEDNNQDNKTKALTSGNAGKKSGKGGNSSSGDQGNNK